jgi:hypothetical protein
MDIVFSVIVLAALLFLRLRKRWFFGGILPLWRFGDGLMCAGADYALAHDRERSTITFVVRGVRAACANAARSTLMRCMGAARWERYGGGVVHPTGLLFLFLLRMVPGRTAASAAKAALRIIASIAALKRCATQTTPRPKSSHYSKSRRLQKSGGLAIVGNGYRPAAAADAAGFAASGFVPVRVMLSILVRTVSRLAPVSVQAST